MKESINHKQIQLIHIAKDQLGMKNEAYGASLLDHYPGRFVVSCKELSYEETEDIIADFKAQGSKIKHKPRLKRPKGVHGYSPTCTQWPGK